MNKKILAGVVIGTLTLSLGISVVLASPDTAQKTNDNFIDENNNGICDNIIEESYSSSYTEYYSV